MMNKPTLLYVSPFWPQKSGISEYSEMLVPGLVDFFEVTLLTKGRYIENARLQNMAKVKLYDPDEDYSKYDYIVYNFGNCPDYHDYMYHMLPQYPGYIILHDISLYYLAVDYYSATNSVFSEIFRMHNAKGIAVIKEAIKESFPESLLYIKTVASELTMNRTILEQAKGIFVHSAEARRMVLDVVPTCDVRVINHVVQDVTYDKCKKQTFRERYGLGEDDFIIGAAGYIANTKMNLETCLAIEKYNAVHDVKVKYIMIGEGGYVDQYLGENILKTGFLDEEDFLAAIDSCDLIFNFRKLYGGEASGPLIQALALGKECAVSDVGWFGELPDDCVCKLKETTEDTIYDIIEKKAHTKMQNDVGKEYVNKYFSKEVIAREIYEWLENR